MSVSEEHEFQSNRSWIVDVASVNNLFLVVHHLCWQNMTLGFRVWSALSEYQTVIAIAEAIGEKHLAVYDSLDRLAKLGFAERTHKTCGPGHPSLWRQTEKKMPDHMLNSASQLANLRKGPKARAEKYRGVGRQDVGRKISTTLRMKKSAAHFAKLKLPKPKCLLAEVWRGK